MDPVAVLLCSANANKQQNSEHQQNYWGKNLLYEDPKQTKRTKGHNTHIHPHTHTQHTHTHTRTNATRTHTHTHIDFINIHSPITPAITMAIRLELDAVDETVAAGVGFCAGVENDPTSTVSVYVLKSTVKVPDVMFARRASTAAAPGASRATAMLPGRACTCCTSSASTCITRAAVTRIASCRSAMGAVCGTVSTRLKSSANANVTAIPGLHVCVIGASL